MLILNRSSYRFPNRRGETCHNESFYSRSPHYIQKQKYSKSSPNPVWFPSHLCDGINGGSRLQQKLHYSNMTFLAGYVKRGEPILQRAMEKGSETGLNKEKIV